MTTASKDVLAAISGHYGTKSSLPMAKDTVDGNGDTLMLGNLDERLRNVVGRWRGRLSFTIMDDSGFKRRSGDDIGRVWYQEFTFGDHRHSGPVD